MSIEAVSLGELYSQALAAAANAYAPYSRFRVGAALLTSTGEVVLGCNVENASFRLTTCAEQNAIAAAVTRFGPKLELRAIAVANLNDWASQPCGACLQTIAEFASVATRILYPASHGALAEVSLADLLPTSFQFAPEGTPKP